MKVLLICNTDGALYVFRRPIIDALVQRGIRVASLSGASRYIAKLAELGVDAKVVQFHRHSILPWSNLKLLMAMRSVIKDENPDVVHCFTHKANIFGAIAAKSCGVKRIVLSVTGLGTLFADDTVLSRVLRRFLKLQYWIVTRIADAVFFQNPDDLHEMTKAGVVPTEKVRLTGGSGLDLAHFPRRTLLDKRVARRALAGELFEVPESSLLLLYPARATIEKGVLEFYAAAKILNDSAPGRFTFVHVGLVDASGKGALSLDEIEVLAKESGVRYLGFKDDIERYMLAADVVVLPSHREGLPRSLVEALAYGKVIIASDAPGCRETVVEGRNGYLARVRDPTSLAACIERISPDLILDAAKVSRDLVEAKFGSERVVEETLRAYGLERLAS